MTDDNLDLENIETPEIVEDEKDNSQETDATIDPKEKRHAEQIAGSKKEVERLQGLAIDYAFDRASQDISSLKELYNKDPKLAEKTADKFDRANSEYGTFKNFIAGKQTSKASPKITEDELEEMLQAREAKREHEKAQSRLEKSIEKLDEEVQEDVQRYIDKYSKGLSLTVETADELLEMATLYVNRDKLKGEKKEDVNIKYSTTSLTNSKKPEKGDMVTVIDFVTGKPILVPNTFN